MMAAVKLKSGEVQSIVSRQCGCGSGLVLLWWQCNMPCSSSFVEGIVFSHVGLGEYPLLIPLHPHFPPFTLYLLLSSFSISYSLYLFSCLFHPSHSTTIVPLHFQARCHSRRLNLSLFVCVCVCVCVCVDFVLYVFLVKDTACLCVCSIICRTLKPHGRCLSRMVWQLTSHISRSLYFVSRSAQ